MRVVLDTNVLARPSFSANGPAAELLDFLRGEEHLLIASDFILRELDRVLRYPRMQRLHGFDDEEIKRYVASVEQAATIVDLAQHEVRAVTTADPNDDPIVATAVIGKADVLCSNDHHLHSPEVVDYCRSHQVRVLNDIALLHELRALGRGGAKP